METYGKILNITTPIFLLLIVIEILYGYYRKNQKFRVMDMVSSLSSGITNGVKDILGLSISLITYVWMVDHWAIFKIESTWLVYVIAFFAIDLSGYWGHRLNHEINILWNQHIIHHSSEEFNLPCALRQSISNLVNIFTIFLVPAAILGVPKEVISIVAPLHLFAQFWYHTIYINRLGILEKFMVTPSHHRVHHAINPIYLDKNHGQVFIFWDKMFGTFQEELPEEPPVYGITRPASSWNPITINFQHFWLMLKDAYRTNNWVDKFRIWFMPTGWRPTDVAEKYPVKKINDIFHFQKFNPKANSAEKLWALAQLLVTLLLLSFLFGNIAKIGSPNMFIYGAFVYLMVFSYTEFMNRSSWAIWLETFKNLIGLAIIYKLGDWFGINTLVSPYLTPIIVLYFITAIIITWYFYLTDIRKDTFVRQDQKMMA